MAALPLQGFFVFLCDQGLLAQSPIQLPRHQILVPTRLPRPMAEAEVVIFFRVIDALQDGLNIAKLSRTAKG